MPISSEISMAVEKLQGGDIVAFPTETVYGLGAQIRDEKALLKIFKTKERPFFDPLICHIHSMDQISELACEWPEWAQILAKEFWPGPLTIVVKKNPNLSPLIVSGLDSVGIRMPRNSLALSLLEQIQIPLAAPSANRFGRTSPTSAEHVQDEFGQDLFILKGDASEIGIESTVVAFDQSKGALLILRPGFITEAKLKEAFQNQKKSIQVLQQESRLSPGHTEFHYQPLKPLVIIPGNYRELSDYDFSQIHAYLKNKDNKYSVLTLDDDPIVSARLLYENMRLIAKQDIDFMIVFKRPEMNGDLWEAIWNRLNKAASCRLS